MYLIGKAADDETVAPVVTRDGEGLTGLRLEEVALESDIDRSYTDDAGQQQTIALATYKNMLSSQSICYEDDTYELTTVDGAVCNENTFEKMFGQLENIYEPFITELISTLDSNKSLKSFLIRDKNRESLIMFMVSMLLRNPIVFGQTQEAGRKCGIEWTKAQSRNNAILHNASLLEGWSKKLHKTHKIVVLKNKSDVDFVTGSFPCSIMSTDENGDTTRGTLVLSPRYMVLLIDKKIREFKEDSVVPVNTFVVDEYNAKIIGNKANKYVISRDKETLMRYKDMWERRRDE